MAYRTTAQVLAVQCLMQSGSERKEEPLCSGEHFFVIGGLRADFSGKTPACLDKELPDEARQCAMEVVPSMRLLRRIWRTQGS